MSGHKRALVQLGRQDLHRFDAIQDKLRQVEQDYQEVRATIQKDRQQQLELFTKDIEFRQNTYQAVLGSYNHEINDLEHRTSQALLNQASYLSGQLESQEQRFIRDNQALLDNHFQSIYLLMQQNQQEVWEHFNQLSQSLDQTFNERHTHKISAEQALSASIGMLNSIRQVYDHERYFPGSVERIAVEIENSSYNLDRGMFEAAIVSAQQATRDLSYMRMMMEETIQREALARTFAMDEVKQLSQLIQKNAYVNAIDLEGNELDFVIDIDFWTSGELSRLYRRCAGLLNQLEAGDHASGVEEYVRIQQFILPQLEESLSDLVADARVKVILSQIRFNIAQTVIENLAEQGFSLQEAVYNDLDERQPYAVIARSLEGSQVKVCIESGDLPGNYSLQIDSQEPGLYSRSELRNRARTLLRSLQSAGLRIGPVSELRPGEQDSVVYNPAGKEQNNRRPLVNYYGN